MTDPQLIPVACNVLLPRDREEKDHAWTQVRNAVTAVTPRRDGFALSLSAPRPVLEAIGKLVALERECCRFLHIRLDVPPSKPGDGEPIQLMLTGGPGAKELLASALRDLGLAVPPDRGPARLAVLGGSALSFGVLCGVLPPVLLTFGLSGAAAWFAALDSVAGVLIAGAGVTLGYRLYASRSRTPRCGDGC